jgi:hypothetical protein
MQAVDSVPGKTGDGLGDDIVYLHILTVGYHAAETRSLICTGTADTLVDIYIGEGPPRMSGYKLAE